MADRRPETWNWRPGVLPGSWGAECPLCGELQWCSDLHGWFQHHKKDAGNKHLAEKHPLPPPEPEGWWPTP